METFGLLSSAICFADFGAGAAECCHSAGTGSSGGRCLVTGSLPPADYVSGLHLCYGCIF